MVENYNDIFINGQVIESGVRETNSRYLAIKEVLKLFQREFTVLDIGASLGGISFRIAEEFPNATVIMIEGHQETAEKLTKFALINGYDNTIVLKHLITQDELIELGKCEYFDVVLALNVIHHFPNPMKETFANIQKLGDCSIIEIPVRGEAACNQDRINIEGLDCSAGKLIAETPSHTRTGVTRPMYMFEHNRPFKQDHCFWKLPVYDSRTISIISTLNNKTISVNKNPEESITYNPYIMGINLATFLMLDGVYPDIIPKLQELNVAGCTDVRPWNIIISGTELTLIDTDDSREPEGQNPKGDLAKIIERIKNDSIKQYILQNKLWTEV